MTKTEAAEILAIECRAWARRAGHSSVTKTLVEERKSELCGPDYAGTLNARAAHLANIKTTLRLATRDPL